MVVNTLRKGGRPYQGLILLTAISVLTDGADTDTLVDDVTIFLADAFLLSTVRGMAVEDGWLDDYELS